MTEHEYLRRAYLSLAALAPDPGMTDDVRRGLRGILSDLEQALFVKPPMVWQPDASDQGFDDPSEGPTHPWFEDELAEIGLNPNGILR
jgi:hypothetical protein